MRASTLSRVVPGISVTMELTRPSSLFASDDLPAFGRPRKAIRGASLSSISSSSGSASKTASRKSPVPVPLMALSG